MPLFEFFRVPKPKGKLDPVQEKPGSRFDETYSRSEDGSLIELGWENGQLLKQSHGSSSSSRASKAQPLNLNNLDNDQDNLKVTKIDNLKEFPPSVELAMSPNDYLVPWLSNFQMQSDYNTHISSEGLGVNLEPQERGSSSFEANRDPLLSSNFTDSGYQLYPPMPFSTLRSQAIDNDGIPTSELQSSNKNNNMGSANFGCFSRPFALMRGGIDKADGSGFSGVGGSRDKAALDVPNIKFGLSKSRVKPTEIIIGSSTLHSGPDKSAGKKVVDGEKKSGSSSVCSGNVVEGGSDEPRNNLKRKFHEAESSEDPSEDVEDESVSVKKQAPTRGAKGKRIRCAEVHNLSERKRRDRINEKMRALQELIPNCNKVDKASMLDEAIEYLKSLQLQLHIMTTGAGMFMSPMMTTMQHMVPPMAHCLNMGIGLGNFARPSMAMPNLQFYGLPGQGFPIPMSRPPFIPLPACQGSEANVRRSRQITDSSHQMKQSKNKSAEAHDTNGSGISNSQKKYGTHPNVTTRRQ